jgi:hypothetical protein
VWNTAIISTGRNARICDKRMQQFERGTQKSTIFSKRASALGEKKIQECSS